MDSKLSLILAVAASFVATAVQAQSGDAARGERVFNQQCKVCHKIEAGAGNTIGPNLHGVAGHKAGAVEGFSYSETMLKSGLVWDDGNLAKYLESPSKVVPNGKMTYAGLKKQDQVDDVIAYLKKASQ
ncbi:MAG TPA: cytochrome c family protein [Reyranella sp.]|nr:cytochrome c family protein [Reyranella sp.]